MTREGLGGLIAHFFAENPGQHRAFGTVVDQRSRTMRVHKFDRFGNQFSLGEGQADRPLQFLPGTFGLGDVKSVGALARAGKFVSDRDAPGSGMFRIFQDQHPGGIAQIQARALRIERTAGRG